MYMLELGRSEPMLRALVLHILGLRITKRLDYAPASVSSEAIIAIMFSGQRMTIVSERGGVRLLFVTSLKKLPVPRAVVVRLHFDHQKEC